MHTAPLGPGGCLNQSVNNDAMSVKRPREGHTPEDNPGKNRRQDQAPWQPGSQRYPNKELFDEASLNIAPVFHDLTGQATHRSPQPPISSPIALSTPTNDWLSEFILKSLPSRQEMEMYFNTQLGDHAKLLETLVKQDIRVTN